MAGTDKQASDWKKDLEKIAKTYGQLDMQGGTRTPPYAEIAAFVEKYKTQDEIVPTLRARFNNHASTEGFNVLTIIANHAVPGSELETMAATEWKSGIEYWLSQNFTPSAMNWILPAATSSPAGSLLEKAAVKFWKTGIERVAEKDVMQAFGMARQMLMTANAGLSPKPALAEAAQDAIDSIETRITLGNTKPSSYQF